jgi:hypothetical protein
MLMLVALALLDYYAYASSSSVTRLLLLMPWAGQQFVFWTGEGDKESEGKESQVYSIGMNFL